MNIELVNEIRSLIEEYISEVSDELVSRVKNKRQENYDNAIKAVISPEFERRAYNAIRNNDMEEAKKLGKEHKDLVSNRTKKKEKLEKFKDLEAQRSSRQFNNKAKLERFRSKLIDKGINYKETKKAGEEHNNALINQGLRNKLEKSLKVSESCLSNLITLIEGEIIDFQKKRKEKVLDRNAYKMAGILRSGKLKVTRTGELIGDPEAMKQVKDIEKENREVGLGRKVGLN